MSTNPTQQESVSDLGQKLLDAVYDYEQHGEKVAEKVAIIEKHGPVPVDARAALSEVGGISGVLDTLFERERLVEARGRALDAYVNARKLVEAPSGQTAETDSV